MKSFSIKRYWHTLRWYLTTNRNQQIAWTLGIALILLTVHLLFLWVYRHSLVYYAARNATYGLGFDIFICSFAALIATSSIFSPVKKKQQRIAYLTLPATNLERFLVALTNVLVVWPICIFIAFVLSDTLRMIILGILTGTWSSALASIHLPIPGTIDQALMALYSFATTLWLVSVYVLAGTWLRRHPFAITTFALIILSTVLSVICMRYIASNINSLVEFFLQYFNPDNVRLLVLVSSLVIIALSLFHFWLSFRIFRRFQIVTSKWTNL